VATRERRERERQKPGSYLDAEGVDEQLVTHVDAEEAEAGARWDIGVKQHKRREDKAVAMVAMCAHVACQLLEYEVSMSCNVGGSGVHEQQRTASSIKRVGDAYGPETNSELGWKRVM
jgi:Rieske Fe-S protein